jgi:hypothetical protein
MLEQDGRGNGIDISLAPPSGAAHFPNRAERGGSGESLVHETHGEACSFLELRRDVAGLDGSRRVVTIAIKRQANHKALDLELGAAANHLGDGRPLAAATLDEPGWRCDGPSRVADGEANTTVTVINREEAIRESGIGNRESGIGELIADRSADG